MKTIILTMFLTLSLTGCPNEQEKEDRLSERIKDANANNRHYWNWVEQTMECGWSGRLQACLCVFQHEVGAGFATTSEMGLTFAPNRTCGKAD